MQFSNNNREKVNSERKVSSSGNKQQAVTARGMAKYEQQIKRGKMLKQLTVQSSIQYQASKSFQPVRSALTMAFH